MDAHEISRGMQSTCKGASPMCMQSPSCMCAVQGHGWCQTHLRPVRALSEVQLAGVRICPPSLSDTNDRVRRCLLARASRCDRGAQGAGRSHHHSCTSRARLTLRLACLQLEALMHTHLLQVVKQAVDSCEARRSTEGVRVVRPETRQRCGQVRRGLTCVRHDVPHTACLAGSCEVGL